MSLRAQYICTLCQHFHTKWWGWCQSCGGKDCLEEEIVDISATSSISDITSIDIDAPRIRSGWTEFDLICGGGIVPGSVLLLGGEPGIGKSTLLSQLCSKIGSNVIYFSGEESLSQIKLRAQRLKLQNFQILATGILKEIINIVNKERPKMIVIDSIQTLKDQDNICTTDQIRIFAFELIQAAKKNNCAMILVGHVTKAGTLAGPKLLEHMVDVVLNFEGDQETRVLRSTKNRFGSTQEIVLFRMTEEGLSVIEDPSTHLCRSHNNPTVGSIIFPSIEGSKPILVEIQALVSQSYLQMPRRSVVGWCYNRLAMILAILEKHSKIMLGPKDIYLNIVGGFKITDSATADLAVAIAIWSSAKNIPIPASSCAFGEITLSGEIRQSGRAKDRIYLATKHGVNQVISSAEISTMKELGEIIQNLNK